MRQIPIANSRLKTYSISPALGINQIKDKAVIGITNHAVKAKNIDTKDGSISLCKGTERYGTSSVPTPIGSLMVYFQGFEGTIMAVSGGKLYKLASDVLTEIASGYASDIFDYINYQTDLTEIIIYTNGTDNVKVWDGTTIRDLKLNGKDSVAGAGNISPKGKFILLHKERVWILDDLNAYFSAAFDPDDWTAPITPEEVNMHGGQIALPTWDGGKVLAANVVNDDIIIHKTNSVHKIFGTYPGNYSIVNIFNMTEGEIIDKTVTVKANLCFWTTTKGIEMYNGVDPVPLTPWIQDEFDSINKSYISKAVAVIYDNKYILAVPKGESTVNNMIIEYDTQNNTFMIKEGIEVNSFLKFGDILLYADNTGKLFKYDTGTTYGGNTITAEWTTGSSSFGDINSVKTASMEKILASGNGNVKISIISEKRTKTKEITLTSTEKPYKVNLTHSGYVLSFKFENVNGSDFKLIQPQFDVEF